MLRCADGHDHASGAELVHLCRLRPACDHNRQGDPAVNDPAYRHGGPDAGWYLRTMDGWRRVSDTEAARVRYEGMRHFMHDPRECGEDH